MESSYDNISLSESDLSSDFFFEKNLKTTERENEKNLFKNEYNCFKHIRIVIYNEIRLLYDYIPYTEHASKKIKYDQLQEMLFGSVALNYSMDEPVYKYHQINSKLFMISILATVNSLRKYQSNDFYSSTTLLSSNRATSPEVIINSPKQTTTNTPKSSFSSIKLSNFFGKNENEKFAKTTKNDCKTINNNQNINKNIIKTNKNNTENGRVIGVCVIFEVKENKIDDDNEENLKKIIKKNDETYDGNDDDDDRMINWLVQIILKQFKVIECNLITLVENLFDGLKQRSGSLINESIKIFLNKLSVFINIKTLSYDNLSIDAFVNCLISLIKETDNKSTNFFLSKLISTILIYQKENHLLFDESEENNFFINDTFEIIIASRTNIYLIKRILIVIEYFLHFNFIKYNKNFDTPKVHLQSKTFKEKSFVEENDFIDLSHKTMPKVTIASTGPTNIIRKSRDESLGYGSLSDSETAVNETRNMFKPQQQQSRNCKCNESDEFLNTNATVASFSIDEPKNFNQSKLYMKEYQNLRFTDTSRSLDKRNFDEHLNNEPKLFNIENSSKSFKQSNNGDTVSVSKNLSINEIDNYLIEDSNDIENFGKISLPSFKVSSLTLSSDIIEQPVIAANYLNHFKLQGICFHSNNELYIKRCCCPMRPKIVIVANVDQWSVTINSLEHNSSIPASMSTQIGQLCENLIMFNSIGMKSPFILGYLESILNEIKLKSDVLNKLNQTECNFSSNSLTQLYLNSSISPQDIIFSLFAFDTSDLPLLTCSQQQQPKFKLAETKF